jgi:hypothetical protein
VAALDSLAGVADRPAFLERAAAVTTETGAIYYATSAEMLARFHATSPLALLVPAQAAAVALTKDGRPRPPGAGRLRGLDAAVAQGVGVAVQRAKEDFASARPEVWITGGASERTRRELTARGWKLETGKLGPENPLAKSGGQ